MKSYKNRGTNPTATILTALVLILVFASVALAATSATLLDYQIDFLGFTDNGDNTSTWTYAVTADGDETNGLSHGTLGIDSCYEVISPSDGATYTTITAHPTCSDGTYSCIESKCTAVYGDDPTTGVDGIKFEDCAPQLGEDDLLGTHIFQFTVNNVPNVGGNVDIAMKYGSGEEVGTITGPACSPTAVALASLSANSGYVNIDIVNIGLIFLLLISSAVAGFLLYRQRRRT